MTTAREHMAADMAYLFGQDGEEVQDLLIDGVSRRVIVQELEVIAGGYEGAAISRRALWLNKSTITLPRPGYAMIVDGELWEVESTDPTGLVDIIYLAKYAA